ncbi:MAG: hypothetical protein OK455_05105 [Thaumarchaeota archaeon]|nr:hypothetical protein [Nitrososphaerota archaeon]
MLRFELHQLYVPSLDRFFLPLPKLTGDQIRFLVEHLKERGFKVKHLGQTRWSAKRRSDTIRLDGSRGLAKSSSDLLDSLGPAIPRLLTFPRVGHPIGASGLYFQVKTSGNFTEIQLFPRLESLTTWTRLRGDGLCGLTPDEALVIRRLLEGGDADIECVSATPRQGSKPRQVGRNQYYASRISAQDFLASLRDISLNPAGDAYLPRGSVITLTRTAGTRRASPKFDADELDEWCYLN